MTDLIIHHDDPENPTPSFCVAADNTIWFIHTYYDHEGMECEAENAVTASIHNEVHGYGTAILHQMTRPEVH